MSPNPYPLFSTSQYDKPEQIRLKIRMLIRLYIKDPGTFTAQAVVNHIAALLAYPKYVTTTEERCLLKKLEMHWRCLAWINNNK